MKIAIIGTGIAGLGAGFLLHRDHEITIYEQAREIGGHSRTRLVPTCDGDIPVDTGFIVYNRRNYPHLTAMFEHLNVPTAPSNMSFGVTVNLGRDDGWLEYSARHLFAQPRNLVRPDFYRMLRDILQFGHKAKTFVARNPEANMADCQQALGLGDWFVRYYLLAMAGAIWSSPAEHILQFPARTLITFFDNHGLLDIRRRPAWYTVRGGSREYVSRLCKPFAKQIRYGCAARQIIPRSHGVQVRDGIGDDRMFDQVILACHSDQAAALLPETLAAREVLCAIPYQKNRAVLHGDLRVMPKRKKAWASWVYRHDECHNVLSEQSAALTMSYWMNNLQPLATHQDIFVTLNPAHDPETIYDDHVFYHPLFDNAAIRAQAKLPSLQGRDRLWFCGAWTGYGFHEDGLKSAVSVAQHLGSPPPWRTAPS
ncbi:MAG: FAD-dependent oxidoreductase [Pseudomonadota bacterium]